MTTSYTDYEYKGWTLRIKQYYCSEFFHGTVCFPLTPFWQRHCEMCKEEMSAEIHQHFMAVFKLLR